jgi:integrase
LADNARALTRKGIDPIDKQVQDPVAAQAAKRAEVIKTTLFRDYAEHYITGMSPLGKIPSIGSSGATRSRIMRLRSSDTCPWQRSTRAVMRVLEPIWNAKPETASRLRGRIESILEAAKVEHLRDGGNPARWKGCLKHLLPRKSKVREVQHHKAVPWHEMRAFMAELQKRPGQSARCLEIIVLTAVRENEACSVQWEEIDLVKGTWTIPGSRIKAGKEHRVPLCGRVLEILAAYTPEQRHCSLFPSYKGRPISIAAPLKLLKEMARDETTHGMRSAFKDWAEETTNYPDWVAKKALAHTIGDETDRAYQRGDLLEKRQQLMQAWGALLHTYTKRTKAINKAANRRRLLDVLSDLSRARG